MRRPRRGIVALDRAAGVVGGLALLLAGLLLVGLGTGWVQGRRPATPDVAETARVVRWSSETWWPWALVGGAVVVGGLALWWLVAHRPAPRVTVLALPGDSTGTRLRVSVSGALDAACRVIERDPQVRSASLGLASEREGLVVTGRVRVEPGAALDAVENAVATVLDDLPGVLGVDDGLAARVHLAVAPRGTTARRIV